MKGFFQVLCLCLLAGCQKHYVNVKREYVDRGSLASSFVGSPDPAQKDPPMGQKLFVEWNLPSDDVKKGLILTLKIIFRNYQEETISYAIDRRRGWITYELLDERFYETKGLLTYKADITTIEGEVVKEWKQQLWVNLIKLEEE